MKRRKTYAQLKRELDRVFSLWVRWKAADKKGLVACFTCQKKAHVKSMQAGHFISRHYLAVRWSEANVKPQCYRCNIALKGNYPEFAFRLGQEVVGQLLFDNPDLMARLGGAGREYVRRNFLITRHLGDYLALLASLTG